MDMRLIMLGIIFVVLMVAFGKNPMEGSRDTRPGDPFQRSLQDKLKEEGSMSTLSGYGYMSNAGTTNAANYTQQQAGMHMPGIPINNMPQTPNTFNAPHARNKGNEPESPQVPAFYLNDGRRIFFSGYKVFVLALDGSIQTLPDGSYKLQTGDTILIREGMRVAPEKPK